MLPSILIALVTLISGETLVVNMGGCWTLLEIDGSVHGRFKECSKEIMLDWGWTLPGGRTLSAGILNTQIIENKLQKGSGGGRLASPTHGYCSLPLRADSGMRSSTSPALECRACRLFITPGHASGHHGAPT